MFPKIYKGTTKWMEYNGTPYFLMADLGGTKTIFGNTPKVLKVILSHVVCVPFRGVFDGAEAEGS